MIKKLELNNCAAFKKLSVDFGPKINVIIGENGTGKTQLLKAGFVLCAIGSVPELATKPSKAQIADAFTDMLLRTYKPTEDRLVELYHRGGSGAAKIAAQFALTDTFAVNFTRKSSKVKVTENLKSIFKDGAVLIPTKEVISFLDGISSEASDSSTLDRLFDYTYFSLVNQLVKPRTVDEEQKAVWFFEDTINILGGQFVFDGPSVSFKEGKFRDYKSKHASKTYFAPSKLNGISACMTAEGYRKIGVLQRLLENQVIGTGVSGPLFWDEPDSNMNPKLMKLLVQLLLDLSRNGQQIILATHDYVLLKWFDLLMDVAKEDHVRYHVLHRDTESNEIKVEHFDDYLAISPNAIADTFNDLTREQVRVKMEALGK